mgnify:CR=1 FL=1
MVINTRKKDIFWNYLGIFASLCSQIILLPILVRYLKPEDLGLWYIFVSIGAIVILFDFGFNPTIARTVAYCWSGVKELKKTDIDKVENNIQHVNYELLFYVIKICKKLYLFIATLALFFMLILGTWYIVNIMGNKMSLEIYMSWIIYVISIFLNLYIGYYSVALRGIGDVYNQNRANVLSKIVFFIIGTIGLVLGYNILSLAVANLFSGCVMRMLCAYFFYNVHDIQEKFKNIKFSRKYQEKDIFFKIWYNSWREGAVSISLYLTTQMTTLICATFLPLSLTGIYSFCLQIVTAITNIASGLYVSYQPSLQSAYVNNDKYLLKKRFSLAVFVYYCIYFLGIIIFIFIGVPIIYYIKNDFLIDKYIFIILAINFLFIQRHRLSTSFISNMNKLPYVNSFIISSILGVIITFCIMKYFNGGILALIVVPLIIQTLYNNWKWNKVVNFYLGINELILIKIGYNELKSKILSKK